MSRKEKKAVSLVEILVAALILGIVVAGIVSVFFTARNYIARANKRSVATSLSHSNLRVLPGAVREDTWGSGDLSLGTTSLPQENIDLYSYSGRRIVRPVEFQDYRQVEIRVSYPD